MALPLAIAFAIASGVTPDRGLYTVVIAGFIDEVLEAAKSHLGIPPDASTTRLSA